MKLRKHQAEFKAAIDNIKAGAPIKTILAHVCPGGGKSLIPILAGELISCGMADAICWVVPRTSLQIQGEGNFIDPFFRNMIGHTLTVRASTNEVNPCRGLNGFVTTYQAIGLDTKQTVVNDFRRRRYILILDEFHHVEVGGPWEESLAPLVAEARFAVLMTGTIERGDAKQVAFMPYRFLDTGKKQVLYPVLRSTETIRYIEYSRSDALSERSILPLKFHLYDGRANWKEHGRKKATNIKNARGRVANRALYTALRTEYAEDILTAGVDHWNRYKQINPGARLLVVCANIDLANKAVAFLRSKFRYAEVATSADTPAARKAIRRFKDGKTDVLVGVALFYEGFDCKQISHIISLTHIRSAPWILQMVSRAVRIDPAYEYDGQYGYVFAPDDVLFQKVVQKIESEQTGSVTKMNKTRQISLFATEGETRPREPDFVPLNSKLADSNEFVLGNNSTRPWIAPKTPSETEAGLLSRIESHVRQFTFENYYKPGRINAEIKTRFGKSRREMTLSELQRCWEYIQQTYPLGQPRGGKKRGPSKAFPYDGIATI